MTAPISPSDTPIRRGSPFAKSTVIATDAEEISSHQAFAWQATDSSFDPEWGVLRAANWASAWVVVCGIACLQMFPAGGVVVATLGCGLATIGLFSSRPIAATTLLIIHAGLFFACYQRLF